MLYLILALVALGLISAVFGIILPNPKAARME